jgi:hypothetical protein
MTNAAIEPVTKMAMELETELQRRGLWVDAPGAED